MQVALTDLIQSLSKAEKKEVSQAFRIQKGERTHTHCLYEFLIHRKNPNKHEFLANHKEVDPKQMSNIQASLYFFVLEQLRKLSTKKEIELRIREKIDFATILFGRGLFDQSKAMMKKVSRLAEKYHMEELQNEALYREQIIELHQSGDNTLQEATKLREQTEKASESLRNINAFAGLALQLHAQFTERGYIENEKDRVELAQFFQNHLPNTQRAQLNLTELLYYHRAYFWFYYLQQDFVRAYRHSRSGLELIEKHNLQLTRPLLFFKSLYYVLNTFFRTNNRKRFDYFFSQLESACSKFEKSANRNLQFVMFKFLGFQRMNQAMLHGQFQKALQHMDWMNKGFEDFEDMLESRFVIVWRYKVACLYFGVGDYNSALVYLNRIIHSAEPNFRQDIHGYARILRLVSLFELKEYELLYANARTTYQFFVTQQKLDAFHVEILRFIRKSIRKSPDSLKADFSHLRTQMIQISKNQLARKPFYYFDIISWLESQIYKKPVGEIIREKGLGHKVLFT